MSKDVLALYSRKCKRCGHLDPEETKKFTSCHYSRGNIECPAQEVQIAVVGEAKRLAASLKKAKAEDNLRLEIRILEYVRTKTQAFQHRFKEWTKS